MDMEGSFKKTLEAPRIARVVGISSIAGLAQNLAHLTSLSVRGLAGRVNITNVVVGKDEGLPTAYTEKKHGVVVQNPKPKPDETTPVPPIPPQPPAARMQDGINWYWASQLQKPSFCTIGRLYVQQFQLLTLSPRLLNLTSSRITFMTDISKSSLALAVSGQVQEQHVILEVSDC